MSRLTTLSVLGNAGLTEATPASSVDGWSEQLHPLRIQAEIDADTRDDQDEG
jgi:hypothetical protein